MSLTRKIDTLVFGPVPPAAEAIRAAVKLCAQLCACRARVAALEAESTGQRVALLALNRHENLALDFAAVREAERGACARLVALLGFDSAAEAIRARP